MSVVLRLVSGLQRVTQALTEDLMRIASTFNRYEDLFPALAVSPVHTGEISAAEDPLLWDGFLLATGLGGCPKHKPGLERRRKKKRDLRRFYPFIRSWHMLVPCGSCGGLKKKYHLCETCYNQTRYETQLVRQKLKEAGLDLNQETVLEYKDDKGRFKLGKEKRVFSMDRKRPSGWFSESSWGR